MLENLHKTKKHKDNTCEVRVTHEGKPRGGMDKRLNKEINIRNNRLIPNAIETRCAIGDYDSANDHYTL